MIPRHLSSHCYSKLLHMLCVLVVKPETAWNEPEKTQKFKKTFGWLISRRLIHPPHREISWDFSNYRYTEKKSKKGKLTVAKKKNIISKIVSITRSMFVHRPGHRVDETLLLFVCSLLSFMSCSALPVWDALSLNLANISEHKKALKIFEYQTYTT